jgi:formylglycine-generating enzyme required for sulfatase activity
VGTEKRYALVVGNNAYTATKPLRNAVNDAVSVATTLQKRGFEVETLKDGQRIALTQAIQRLCKKANSENSTLVFYYSGHSLQAREEHWLVPTDAQVENATDIQWACISLQSLMEQFQRTHASTKIMIIEANYNNPFPYNPSSSERLTVPKQVPTGSFIAFSTAPSSSITEVSAESAPYTKALVQAMQMPNLKIEEMFKLVRRNLKAIGQSPWEYSALEHDFYFYPKPATDAAATSSGTEIATNESAEPQKRINDSKPSIKTHSSKTNIKTISADVKMADNPNLICPPPASVLEETKLVSTGDAKEYLENATGIPFKMVKIQGGTFNMGNPNGVKDEKPVHEVVLSDFSMGVYEVTFGEFDAFCEATQREKPNDEGWGRENHPVINVSWEDAKAYCEWLSQQAGRKYRLPTEAEWEFAARSGQKCTYSGNDDIAKVGWYSDNSGNKTHAVGEKLPNAFGLYDMTGNVKEWCMDWYSKQYSNLRVRNPTGIATGSERVARGGGLCCGASNSRLSLRYNYEPQFRGRAIGFRLVSTAD